jgi:hypothetical protein
MEIVLLCLLVAWFLVYRCVQDTATLARRGAAWVADRLGAPEVATWLRDQPSPTQPRTSDGQRILAALGEVAASGVLLLLLWLRLAVIDAIGAARSASRRRPAPVPWEGLWAWLLWLLRWLTRWFRWPRDGEPHAPVRATATRTDRPPPAALPPGQPVSVTFTFTHNKE